MSKRLGISADGLPALQPVRVMMTCDDVTCDADADADADDDGR